MGEVSRGKGRGPITAAKCGGLVDGDRAEAHILPQFLFSCRPPLASKFHRFGGRLEPLHGRCLRPTAAVEKTEHVAKCGLLLGPHPLNPIRRFANGFLWPEIGP